MRTRIVRYSGRVAVIAAVLLLPFAARAVDTTVVKIDNPLKDVNGQEVTTLFDFLKLIYDGVILPIGATVVALAIIWTGFKFVAAQGNPKALQEARQAFLWTVIGSAILLGSWVIANGIGCTVNKIRGEACTASVSTLP